jgi:ubiquinol-cytochrome c reductase cytochrome c subunit
MTRALLLLALLALLAPAAAASPPDYGIVRPDNEKNLPKLELGKELYASNCSMCHGSRGEGVENFRPARASGAILGMGPSLATVPLGTVDFYLARGYMPLHNANSEPHRDRSYPVLLSGREIDAIVAYVGTFEPGPHAPIPHPDPAKGDLAKGQNLFTEHCAGCHQVVAQGGYVTGARVPPLEGDSPLRIAEAVRSGPYLMPKFSKKAISDAELNDIVRYVSWTKDASHPGGWAIGYIGPLPEGMVTWFIALVVLIVTCIAIGKRLKSA